MPLDFSRRRFLLGSTALLVAPTLARAASCLDDAEALAGQTFYRALAAPGVAGLYSFIGVFNPAGSGIDTFIDAMYVWPGVAGQSTEYCVFHYAAPFSTPAFSNVAGPLPILPTMYGKPNGKTQLWLGTYPSWPLQVQVDYLFQSQDNAHEPVFYKFPYPIILTPGDGIAFGNPCPGYENKAGIWIREK